MNQLGQSSNTQVSIGETAKFSEEEINEAVSKVKRKFWGFRGCELTEIWYTEAESNKIAEDYLKYGGGSEKNIDPDNLIGLLSNFKVGSSGGDVSLEPNSTYPEWSWLLIRNSKNGNWHVETWGY
ncbi:DUF4829 domain-containing protein [Ureibacillus chungkukjangi]|uniref:DUF4829 domain-containing protein n=1 Tax=Ureibacillus chungkukjangi TaxID=1202712 RepID=UPI0020417B27|nr:hypothetical protein [Ureibacillus chungkukjangi]